MFDAVYFSRSVLHHVLVLWGADVLSFGDHNNTKKQLHSITVEIRNMLALMTQK